MGNQENDNEATVKPTKTVFLDDLPTDDDAIGPHKGIARAISEIIHDETIQGGKTIGLTGAWGSGKSTVMELVRRKFDARQKGNGPEAKIFIFDSWAHQGDPLRRAFLEKLGEYLSRRGWGQKEDWTEPLNALKTVKRTTKTIRTSGLSKAGKVFVVTLFLTVVANSLLNHYAWDTPFPDRYGIEGAFAWLAQPVIGWLLFIVALSPLLVVWGIRVRRRLWPAQTENAPNDRESPLSLLLQKTPEEETTTSEREANPTSIEFYDCFLKMLRSALETRRQRRLVIALDNLDRIDPEDALNMISTMRVFIDPLAVLDEPILKRLWIILPVDLNGLQQLWLSTNGSQPYRNSTQYESDSADSNRLIAEGMRGQKAAAFVDKIFQIRFHVPEPVLPSWQPYLSDLLTKAFPELSVTCPDSFSLLARLFHVKHDSGQKPLSPRDVKTFVNRLVAIYRLRPEMPLSILALWVLYFDEIVELGYDFAELGFARGHVGTLVEKDVQVYSLGVYLAAIHLALRVRAYRLFLRLSRPTRIWQCARRIYGE